MSAPDTRLIALNKHDRYEIEAAMILAGSQQENGERLCPEAASTLRELLAAYDAAPADPAEAIERAIDASSYTGGRSQTQGEHCRVHRVAVMAALGCVVERPANTGDHQ